ncbi:hypothetical protein DRQ53_07785 [bacterium]|nr:MAG: hypothetical protein DRQ32_04355 [bacterium]RKZ15904.1 MAG: hypothetical protein DRQ53_07785 [bacterium]
MSDAVIISCDTALRQKIPGADVRWVETREQFEAALGEGFAFALVDVCSCQEDVAQVIRDCRERANAHRIVAFLSECAGDDAIRAHIAGADRIISVDQLEEELATSHD